MQCPKCQTEMTVKKYKGVEIDRCPKCLGIFLDKGELQKIEDQQMGAIIDICAYSQKKEEMDAVGATCHRCGQQMMALKGAGDVTFDWCDKCEGIFLDKGELACLHFFTDV
jgi:Zn-finger nucleic acid-binding protein